MIAVPERHKGLKGRRTSPRSSGPIPTGEPPPRGEGGSAGAHTCRRATTGRSTTVIEGFELEVKEGRLSLMITGISWEARGQRSGASHRCRRGADTKMLKGAPSKSGPKVLKLAAGDQEEVKG